MTLLFDSSVLVGAYVDALSHHDRSSAYLQRCQAGEDQLLLSTHAIAEVFSTLTALPLSPPITATQACTFIEKDILEMGTVLSLDEADYRAVVQRMTDLGLPSGAIYDALHVRAAETAEADQLVTCNGTDFRRMPPRGSTELVVLS